MEKSFDSHLTDEKKIELLSQNNGLDDDIQFLGYLNLVAYMRKDKFVLAKKSADSFFPNELEPHQEKFRQWLKEIIEDVTHQKF